MKQLETMPEAILFEYSQKDFDQGFPRGQWHQFHSIEDIPACQLFSYSPLPLKFKPAPGNNDFDIIHLPIKEVLNLLKNEQYNLNSFRWHRVRKQISQDNEIEYPWVYMNDIGEVHLMDGRHRLIGMAKLKKMIDAPVQVEAQDKAQILEYFKK